MISGNERLIVVVGMAHSGTTILTYVLQQHPNVVCCSEGSEAWLFENSWLPTEQNGPIQQLLNQMPRKSILLKRPWNCVWHADWMAMEMPDAKYLYCQRPPEDIAASWSKSTSFVDDTLRNGGFEFQKRFYDTCLEQGMTFGARVKNFKVVHHLDFISNPQRMIDEITNYLGLPPAKYDISAVSKEGNIKHSLWEKYHLPQKG